MPEATVEGKARRALLGPRNIVALAAAVGCVIAGYLLLQAGSASLAAVLLVVGYCVLFPVAIAL